MCVDYHSMDKEELVKLAEKQSNQLVKQGNQISELECRLQAHQEEEEKRIRLDNLKNVARVRFIEQVYDISSTVEDILRYGLEAIQKINGGSIRVSAYEVRPLAFEGAKGVLDGIKQKELGADDIFPDRALFHLLDSNEDVSKRPERDRWLSLRKKIDTATSLSYRESKPVVSVPEFLKYEKALEDFIFTGNVGDGRFEPTHKIRAAFPGVGFSGEVDYVYIMYRQNASDPEKTKPFSLDELQFARDMVDLVSYYVAAKKSIQQIRDIAKKDGAEWMIDMMRNGLHNVKSPLGAIGAYAVQMIRAIDSGHPNYETLRKKMNMVVRCVNLFEMYYKRMKDPSNYVLAENMDANKIINDTVSNIQESGIYDNITIKVDSNTIHNIVSDPVLLEIALYNMIKNSSEASDGRCEVIIKTKKMSDGRILLQYRDNCGGFDPEVYYLIHLKKETITTKDDGTGIGVKSIMADMGQLGTIKPFNIPGKGSGYNIILRSGSND